MGELLPQSTSVLTESAQPLPEARASINVRLVIAGRDCQLTLRDSDETRLLVRLAEVLQRFPLPEVPCDPKGPAPRAEGWCQKHGVQMKWNEGKEGRKGWFSHRDAAGAWCKGK